MGPEEYVKLGVTYSVWDGEELLEYSIKSIRDSVDYINVVYQDVSWFGEPCSPSLKDLLMQLNEKGLIDEIYKFYPDFEQISNVNELIKRNVGLEAIKKAGCTHFMVLDTDEMFKKEEFERAKQFVISNDITHSVCNQLMYLTPTLRFSEPANFFAPFIYKVDEDKKLFWTQPSDYPWYMDPTKQVPIDTNSKICFLHNVIMHHYDKVRVDLVKKYRNSAAMLTQEVQNEFLNTVTKESIETKLASGEIVRVENFFNIDIG